MKGGSRYEKMRQKVKALGTGLTNRAQKMGNNAQAAAASEKAIRAAARKAGHEATTGFCQNYLEGTESQTVQERWEKEDAERVRAFKEEKRLKEEVEKARWDALTSRQKQQELDKKAAEKEEQRRRDIEEDRERWDREGFDGGSKKSRKKRKRKKGKTRR